MEVSAIATPFIHASAKRRKNIWYSQKDGNWTDPNTWISNAMSLQDGVFNYPGQAVAVPIFPAVGDDVYINHVVLFNLRVQRTYTFCNVFIQGILDYSTSINNVFISINNLFIAPAGKLISSGTLAKAITVNGIIQSNGGISLNTSFNIKTATNAVIDNLDNLIASSVYYNSAYLQEIAPIDYYHLFLQPGPRKFNKNTVIYGNLNVGFSAADLGLFDLIVYGTTFHAGLMKTGPGSILFIGLLDGGNSASMIFTGLPSVELRGGWSFGNAASLTQASGTWTFTTNNQTFSSITSIKALNVNFIISGAITITITSISLGGLIFNRSIDGNNAISTLDNRGIIEYKANQIPMLTGVLQCDSAANTWRYNATGAQDVKGTTYRTLEFGGSGVKTLLGNVVVNTTAGGSWSITGTASINYNGFTITTI